jgi:hypothetical protein
MRIYTTEKKKVLITPKKKEVFSAGVGFEYTHEKNFSVGLNLMIDDKAAKG